MSNKGITLVEVMLTVLILGIGIAGALMLLTASMVSSQLSWDTTVATTHAEYVFEEMQDKESLSEIVAQNWPQWLDGQEMVLLPEEKINVFFKDEQADPLEIEVMIEWIRKTRKNNMSLVTRLTK